MSDLGTMMVEDALPSLWDRMLRWTAWTAALAIFLSIGWMAMAPDDPLGAVSLWSRRNSALMWVQTLGLGAVSTLIAMVLIGRTLPEAGIFAAALGMAAVTLRGDTAQVLLVTCLETPASCERALALRSALESLCWFPGIAFAAGLSVFVLRWCDGSARASFRPSMRTSVAPESGIGASSFVGPEDSQAVTPRRSPLSPGAMAWRHGATAAGLTLLAVGLLSSPLGNRSVQHGQVCFVVFAGVFFATWAAHRLWPVSTSLWSLFAVPTAAVVAYLWAALVAGRWNAPPNLPSSCFLRVLPLQFIGVGVIAAVSCGWWLGGETADRDGSEPPLLPPVEPSPRRKRR